MVTRPESRLELRLNRVFDAPPDRVFRAFVEPEALRRWKAPGDAEVVLVEVDLRPGGRYRIHMRGKDGTVYRLTGEYREISPPKRLSFTWHWETDPLEKETLVTVDFTDLGGRTEVALVHSGFTEEADRDGHGRGWEGAFPKLAAVF
jgi:uncharacterized protein YndB with AHSA1/START domain